MEELENKNLEEKAYEILKSLEGLTSKEIGDIIYRLKELVEEKTKLFLI